jgi:hypothetical protein
MALIAGTTADLSSFPGSLAEAIDKAMEAEWANAKGAPLPSEGQADRRLLFAAIAQGLFTFLKANQNELINNISLEDVGISAAKNYDVTQLELNL